MQRKAKKSNRSRNRTRSAAAIAETDFDASLGESFGARSFSVRMPATLDKESRSIEIIAATEARVPMPDYERWEMIDEVLMMSGAEIPTGGRCVLLDSHSRRQTCDVIGSASNIRTDGDKLLAKATFAETERGNSAWSLVRDGHVTDLSVGYEVMARTFVPEKTKQVIGGREFAGPVNVATRWRVKEISVTPIGADEAAKMRGLDARQAEKLFQRKEKPEMPVELRKRCEAAGMAAGLDDAAAWKWYAENHERVLEADLKARQAAPATTPAVEPLKIAEGTAAGIEARLATAAEEALRKAHKAEQDRKAALRKYVKERAESLGFDATVQADILSSAYDEREAGELFLEAVAKRQKEQMGGTPDSSSLFSPRVESGAEGRQRLADAIGSQFALRALTISGTPTKKIEELLPSDKRAKGYDDFRYFSLMDMGCRMLEACGLNPRNAPNYLIAQAAMGFPSAVEQMARFGSAGSAREMAHSSGMFSNILLDAMNKTLLAGYTEREFTWRIVFRQAPSVRDFKNIHRVRIGDTSTPVIWPEGSEMEAASLTDTKVTYAVEAYGQSIAFGWQAMVNDDLSAFSIVPRRQGEAFARLANKLCWTQITSNPTMPYDSVALFSSITGARFSDNSITGAISETSLGEARQLLRTMKGVNTRQAAASEAILNLQARYLVVPAAKETTARKFVETEYTPDVNVFPARNQFQSLQVVVEPELDADSTAEWYVFADPSQIDTVELTFLQGQETPVTQQVRDEKTWDLVYQMAQTMAAKAIDHRGMIYSTGS